MNEKYSIVYHATNKATAWPILIHLKRHGISAMLTPTITGAPLGGMFPVGNNDSTPCDITVPVVEYQKACDLIKAGRFSKNRTPRWQARVLEIIVNGIGLLWVLLFTALLLFFLFQHLFR
jgi:hypothetical protein